MRLHLVGRSIHDVNAAAIGFPTGNAGRVMLVGIRDTAIVLFLKLVLFRIWRGIAPQPELLDKALALFVGGETCERLPLLITDDVANVLVQPFLVRGLQLLAKLGIPL